jgi:hypothetical protein
VSESSDLRASIAPHGQHRAFRGVLIVALAVLLTACAPEPMAPIDTSSPSSPSVDPITDSAPAAPSPAVTDSVIPDAPQTPEGSPQLSIVSSGADGINVYASGIVTGRAGTAGTCRLIARSSSGETAGGEVEAQPTPSAMNCGLIEIPVPAGDWTLTLTYTATDAGSSSASVEVTQK